MKTDKSERNGHPGSVCTDGGRELKQERAIRTRGVILNAAACAFAERGFPDVTIVDIADRAAMTKGAVYFHFGNKEALAVAVTEEFYRRLAEVVRPALDSDLPPLEKVTGLLMRVAVSFRDDPAIQAGARLQIERPYISAPLPVPYVNFTQLLAELLGQCQQEAQLPEGAKPEALARVLRSALFGAQHISWVLANREDIIERTEEIIEVMLPAVR